MNRSRKSKLAFLLMAGIALSIPGRLSAQTPGPRLALVIGEGQYRGVSLPTALNDAGLVAQTLQSVGFEVTGAANLDAAGMRRAFGDFLAKVQQAGPDATVFVYLSGQGVQYAGENYIVPIEATIARDSAVPNEAVKIGELTGALSAIRSKAHIVVLDAARRNNFAQGGSPLAGGLVLTDPEAGSLYAYNAAPGTVAPDEPGPYGIYAQSLTEMMRQGGLSLDDIFAQTRLRVNEQTRGALIPWNESKLDQPVVLLPRAPGAPAPSARSDYRSRPIRSLDPGEAYAIVIERDTLAGYQDFLAAYPRDPLAARVRAIVAARREALTWDRTLRANTPNAYWTYMQRYPRGPHIYDARRRLAFLSAPLEPPPRFDVYQYDDLPPPPQDEYRYIDRPYVVFDDGDYPPPPPPPMGFLPPDRDFRREPPPPSSGPGFLPIPIPIPFGGGRGEFGGRPGNIQQPNFGQQGQGGGPNGRPGGGVPPNAQPGVPPQALPQPGQNNVPGAPNERFRDQNERPRGAPGTPPVAPNGTPAVPTPPAPQALPQPGRAGAPPVPGGREREREPGVQPVQPPAAAPVTPAPQTLPQPGRAGAPPVPGGREREEGVRPVRPPALAPVAPTPQALPRPAQSGTPAAPNARGRERNEPAQERNERREAPGAGAPAEPRTPREERPATPPAARVPEPRIAPPVAAPPRAPEPRVEPRVAPVAPPVRAPEPRAAPPAPPVVHAPEPRAAAPVPVAPPHPPGAPGGHGGPERGEAPGQPR